MRLLRYGLELRRLAPEDLELVRNWRNAPHVVSEFEFKEEISPEMHQKWFAALNQETDFYFIISREETPFAINHLKQINWQSRSAEAGIFTGNIDFLESQWPIFSILALMEFAFGPLKLQTLQCKIRKGNAATEKLNRQLGYKIIEGESGKPFRKYSVSMIDYFVSTQKLRSFAEKSGGALNTIEVDPGTTEFFANL